MNLQEKLLAKESGTYKYVIVSNEGNYLIGLGSINEHHFGIGKELCEKERITADKKNGAFAGGILDWNRKTRHAIYYRGSSYGPNRDEDIELMKETRLAIQMVMSTLEGITYEVPLTDCPTEQVPSKNFRDFSPFIA